MAVSSRVSSRSQKMSRLALSLATSSSYANRRKRSLSWRAARLPA